MILQTEVVEEILPIFKEYLGYMGQFYKIYNFDSWRNTALKNLKQHPMADNQLIFVLKEADVIIGFALVNRHLRFNHDGFSIAEFYIQKAHEKKGYGQKLAEHIFTRYSGNWEIAVTFNNSCALIFWEKVIASYTSGNFMEKKGASFKGYGFLFNNNWQ